MKAGSQFIIAIRLLNTFPTLTARLTIISKIEQLHLYCKGDEIQFVETGLFPISFLMKMGAPVQDAFTALQNAKDTPAKITALVPVLAQQASRQLFAEGTKKQISDFFKEEITECRLKMEPFKDAEGTGIITVSQLFYESAGPFVEQISFEELLPNAQIPFKLAQEYMKRTSRIKISAQEGYLLSRLEQTHTLGEILSMVPGDEQATRKALVTLWAFGIVDSQVLDQLLPKIDVPSPKEAPKTPEASGKSVRGESIADLTKLIEQAYYGLDRQDYYAVLGINTRADIDDIKAAYYGLARKYHPDRFYGLSDPVLKEKVDVIFASINVAYETLKNQKRRLEYDSSPQAERRISTGNLMSQSKSAAAPTRDAQLKLAEEYSKKAQKAYDEGNNYQAVQFLKSATQIVPDAAQYWRQLGISLSRNPQWRKESEDAFMKAAELEPKNPENHLYMGFLYKNAGLKLRARKHFASCLELDPSNEIAKREIGEIDTSGPDPETPTSKKGLLGGIFKKK
jgi:curved DNA-binding protein CbpA